MVTIQTILTQFRPKLDNLDLELLIAHELKKTREFVLAYPEYQIKNANLIRRLAEKIARRSRGEPIAYLLGHKEFYGLDFKVTKDTLIPRPETELLMDLAIKATQDATDTKLSIVDVGTGSGNIIISLAKNIKNTKINYFGLDISKEALKVARCNAKKHNREKIKFINGTLLAPLIQNSKFKITCLPVGMENSRMIILANLPYLSKKIYSATAPTVKNFEPKSALYSPKAGLDHYEKLLKQIRFIKKTYYMLHVTFFMEISPEQKKSLTSLIKKILPKAKIEFQKDLAGKWRVCMLELT